MSRVYLYYAFCIHIHISFLLILPIAKAEPKAKAITQIFHLVWRTVGGVTLLSIIINVSSFKDPVKQWKWFNKTFNRLFYWICRICFVVSTFQPFWLGFEYMMRVFELFISHGNDDILTENVFCYDKLPLCALLVLWLSWIQYQQCWIRFLCTVQIQKK